MAYFASVASIPTGLTFTKGSYGPYAPEISRIVSSLVNNDLLGQRKMGRMLAYTVGSTFNGARHVYEQSLLEWRPKIDRVADLFARFRRTRDTEVAATVHLVAAELTRRTGALQLSKRRLQRSWHGSNP